MIDLEKLKALCDAATPGPWEIVYHDEEQWVEFSAERDSTLMHECDARYVTATDPDTVRALIARAEDADRLEQENAESRKRETFARTVAEDRVGRPLKYEKEALIARMEELEDQNRQLEDRKTMFWKLLMDKPTIETTESEMVVLLKDLRQAMICGSDGKVHCYSREETYLCDLLEDK